MKNKDKYDLRFIVVKPYYKVCGCGNKLTDDFTFDVHYKDKVVAKGIKAKEKPFKYLMEWLEQDTESL